MLTSIQLDCLSVCLSLRPSKSRWDSSHGPAQKTLSSASAAGFFSTEPLEEATALPAFDGNGEKKNVDSEQLGCTASTDPGWRAFRRTTAKRRDGLVRRAARSTVMSSVIYKIAKLFNTKRTPTAVMERNNAASFRCFRR